MGIKMPQFVFYKGKTQVRLAVKFSNDLDITNQNKNRMKKN